MKKVLIMALAISSISVSLFGVMAKTAVGETTDQEDTKNEVGNKNNPSKRFICPEGTYVTSIFGRSGADLDKIGFSCGTYARPSTKYPMAGNQSLDDLDPNGLGGNGGGPFDSIDSKDGFRKIEAETHRPSGWDRDIIGWISAYPATVPLKSGGEAGKYEGNAVSMDCKDKQIIGMELRWGLRVDYIRVICGTVAQQ